MNETSSPSPAEVNRTLKERAKAIARPLDHVVKNPAVQTFLQFHLASEHYAIEQRYVREVYPLRDLTPVPGTPGFIRGLLNVRSRILPMIDIQRFFEMPEVGITDLHMAVIVQVDDVELGIVTDNVSRMREINLDTCQRTLPTFTGLRAQYTRGITSDHVAILDIVAILNDPRILVNDEPEN